MYRLNLEYIVYEHECDYVWADFRALIDKRACDYPLGWNVILVAEYT